MDDTHKLEVQLTVNLIVEQHLGHDKHSCVALLGAKRDALAVLDS
jgi:hypothetical protein